MSHSATMDLFGRMADVFRRAMAETVEWARSGLASTVFADPTSTGYLLAIASRDVEEIRKGAEIMCVSAFLASIGIHQASA